ncbi:MAG: GTP cyclohydrolase II [Kiritimatiellia bacterium]|jgi:GTP cyclohydrolase II
MLSSEFSLMARSVHGSGRRCIELWTRRKPETRRIRRPAPSGRAFFVVGAVIGDYQVFLCPARDVLWRGLVSREGSMNAQGPTLKPADAVGLRAAVSARLPSRFGDFVVVAFETADGKEHGAVIRGEVRGRNAVPLRIHSECFTGDIMGSLRCDCRDQLEAALDFIGQQEFGVVIYLRQEGRGIGLVNKIRAYALQDAGLDTVEANHALGFDDDLRTYDLAAGMIRLLGIRSVQLITNNPSKIDGLEANGVAVDGRIPHKMPSNPHNAGYLKTKKLKSGHLL